MWVSDIKFRIKLSSLQRQKRRTEASYKKAIEKARTEKNDDAEQTEVSSMFAETDLLDEKIRKIWHNYLIENADKLLIPYPKYVEESKGWVRSEISGDWTLTEEALAKLSGEVRRERRERIEMVFLWPSALVGLLGGVMGIISYFAK